MTTNKIPWDGNPSRVRLAQFIETQARAIPDGALVLDAGAGEHTYASMFDHTDYESADFEQVDKPYRKATYTCDLVDIPVDSDRYDAVLCSQVLEHIPEPLRVLTELRRVLKPGGQLWLTAPLFYEEHEKPYDFFRYTQFGLRHLLEAAGFEVDSVEPLEGYFATLSYQAKTVRAYLPRAPAAYGGGIEGLFVSLCAYPIILIAGGSSRLLARLEMRYKVRGVPLTKNYAVVAHTVDYST